MICALNIKDKITFNMTIDKNMDEKDEQALYP